MAKINKSEHRRLTNIMLKMCKENDVNPENVFIDEDYGYVHTVDLNERDIDFCKTEYRGETYKCRYLDGCFNPFILPTSNKATFALRPE